MPHTTQNPMPGADETLPEMPAPAEKQGCLFALSQPPLMVFLAVVGTLIAITGFYDLCLL